MALSDARKLLAHFQRNRDIAEETKNTFLAKARDMETNPPPYDPYEKADNTFSPIENAAFKAQHLRDQAGGQQRRAETFGEYIAVLSWLIERVEQ
jgi:hypothetical protein